MIKQDKETKSSPKVWLFILLGAMVLLAIYTVIIGKMAGGIVEEADKALQETITTLENSDTILYYKLSDDNIEVVVHRENDKSVAMEFSGPSISIYNPEEPELMEVWRSEGGYFVKYMEEGNDGSDAIMKALHAADGLESSGAKITKTSSGVFSKHSFDDMEIITSCGETLMGIEGDTTWVVTTGMDDKVINQVSSEGIDFLYPDLDISALEEGDIKDILVDAFGDVGLLDYIKY